MRPFRQNLSLNLPLVVCLSVLVCPILEAVGDASEEQAKIPAAVVTLLEDQCVICHDEETNKAGLDIGALLREPDSTKNVDLWTKLEQAIAKDKMPPDEGDKLSAKDVQPFAEWFERQFVLPGNVEHPGPALARRLTREELQNTLEDILHVDLRVPVTNSRLHVIPDTVIEKFFAAGVRGPSGFSNDYETLRQEAIDLQTYARCLSLILSLLDSNDEAREKIFGMTEVPEELDSNTAKGIIQRFADSAFRRPTTAEELQGFVDVYERGQQSRAAYAALKSSMLAVLLSPPFMYRFETPASKIVAVSDQELAVRLSYFLWSSPPDDELKRLAAAGTLHLEETLRQQVRRMLNDPRRIALAENLGGEWFDYKKLRQQSSVNKRSDRMAGFYRTQYEEALLFFDSIVRFDQSIFHLVDADWGFSNRHQLGIYRLQTGAKDFSDTTPLEPIGVHFRSETRQVTQGNYEYKHAPLTLVKFNDPNRGGFVTLGPTLSVTSTQNRTSPIRRGVWVMERILGEHFEPPKDVPDLEESQKRAKTQNLKLTHNEILKLHSSQPGCSSCHKYIDPIGFGLEVYDQMGIARNVPEQKKSGEKLEWTPKMTPGSFERRSWPLKNAIKGTGEVEIHFQWTKGRHRLDVKNLTLTNGELVLADAHHGFTGSRNSRNNWHVTVPPGAPEKGWVLSADVKGDGGSDSTGQISILGPNAEKVGFKLPNGMKFSSPAELKQRLLLDYREQIIDNAVKRVFAYALGRKILPIDRPALAHLKRQLADEDFRMTALIEGVVLSRSFRFKEDR